MDTAFLVYISTFIRFICDLPNPCQCKKPDNSEFRDFVFEVWDRGLMGGDEGRVMPGRSMLILRQDVYDDACRNGGRGRFTAARELGHYLMHREISFARACSDEDPIYCDAEWQADTFAGNLLMPRDLATKFSSATEVSEAFGTSLHAASVMLAKYRAL